MIVCISEFWLSALLLITKSYRAITFGYKQQGRQPKFTDADSQNSLMQTIII